MYLTTTRISLFISLINSMMNKLDVMMTGLIRSAYTTTAILDFYSKDITLNSVSVFEKFLPILLLPNYNN
jgi:hypothetical protein